MKFPAHHGDSIHGFTLLEVVLATGISAIVLVAINTVFFGALRLRNQTTRSTEQALQVERTLDILRSDLSGLMNPGGSLSGQLQTSLRSQTLLSVAGERVSPDFYSNAALVDDTTPFSEVQKVSYYLTAPTSQDSGRGLVRVVTRNLLSTTTEEPYEQWLMDGIDVMAFSYFDGREWAGTWDSTVSSNLPVAIRVQMTMVHSSVTANSVTAPFELVVPIAVEPLTNITAESTEGGR